nr:craniofacial development protein 2-like [Parasteatoda tepidariorum]
MPARASAPGRVTQAGLVGGETPDEEEHPGPPGWGLGVGPTTPPCKKLHVTKSQVENKPGLTLGKRTGNGLRHMRIGSWNVRSLYRNKGLQMLIEQVDSYRIDLLAVQEIRWTGEGIIEKKNHTVVYSCDREKHMFGTGFILSKRIRPLLIDFDCRTPRLCKIRIKGIFFNCSFINFHAPTEDKYGAEKELFYEELHRLYNSCPKNDVKIFLGDANAKIGVEKEFRPVIGGYSLHDISNDNGKRLIDFATDHNMVIPSTMFQHKRIHKMTWKSPNGNTYNQIDHILIDSRHKSDILDVRSYRGANIDSDHFLVLAEVRARISNTRKARGERLKKYDGEQLKKETTRKKFQEQIERRLEVTDDSSERDDVNREWNVIKRALIETGDQVVEKIERTGRKDWFDNDCFMATYKKNEAYKRMISSRHARNAENAYKEITAFLRSFFAPLEQHVVYE